MALLFVTTHWCVHLIIRCCSSAPLPELMLHTGNPWGNRSFITVCQPGEGGKKKQTQCDAYMEFKVTAVLVSLGCSKCVFQGMTDTAGTVIAWIPETSLAFWVSGCLAKCLGHDSPSGGVSQAVNKTRRDKWLHSTKQQLSFGRQTLKPYLKSQTHPLCGSRGLSTHQNRLELLHPACFILPEPVPADCTVSFPTFTAI